MNILIRIINSSKKEWRKALTINPQNRALRLNKLCAAWQLSNTGYLPQNALLMVCREIGTRRLR